MVLKLILAALLVLLIVTLPQHGIAQKSFTANLVDDWTSDITKANDIFSDSSVMVEPFSSMEKSLMVAPVAINLLSKLILIAASAKVDIDLTTVDSTVKYEHLDYPHSFTASMSQVGDAGYQAFIEAHKKMYRIQLLTKGVPAQVKGTLDNLYQPNITKSELNYLLPQDLNSVKQTADECSKLAQEIVDKFQFVTDICQELQAASIAKQGHTEIAQQKLDGQIILKNQTAEDLEERKADSLKYFEEMKRDVAEAKELFNEAKEKTEVNDWAMIGQGLLKAIGPVTSAVVSGIKKHKEALRTQKVTCATHVKAANDKINQLHKEMVEKVDKANKKSRLPTRITITLSRASGSDQDAAKNVVVEICSRGGDCCKTSVGLALWDQPVQRSVDASCGSITNIPTVEVTANGNIFLKKATLETSGGRIYSYGDPPNTNGARCLADRWQQNGKFDCCSSTYQCGENEGDCDDDSQCKPGLVCGDNNCNSRFGDGEADCCVKDMTLPTLGRKTLSVTTKGQAPKAKPRRKAKVKECPEVQKVDKAMDWTSVGLEAFGSLIGNIETHRTEEYEKLQSQQNEYVPKRSQVVQKRRNIQKEHANSEAVKKLEELKSTHVARISNFFFKNGTLNSKTIYADGALAGVDGVLTRIINLEDTVKKAKGNGADEMLTSKGLSQIKSLKELLGSIKTKGTHKNTDGTPVDAKDLQLKFNTIQRELQALGPLLDAMRGKSALSRTGREEKFLGKNANDPGTAETTQLSNAFFVLEQAKNNLKNAKQAKDAAYQETQLMKKELNEVMRALTQLNLDNQSLIEVLRVLELGIKALGDLKKEWTQLLLYFNEISNRIDVAVGETLTEFVNKGSFFIDKSPAERVDYTRIGGTLWRVGEEASLASYFIYEEASIYYEISNNLFIDKVTEFSKLVALDATRDRRKIQSLRRQLDLDTEKMEKDIQDIIDKREAAFQEKLRKRKVELNNSFNQDVYKKLLGKIRQGNAGQENAFKNEVGRMVKEVKKNVKEANDHANEIATDDVFGVTIPQEDGDFLFDIPPDHNPLTELDEIDDIINFDAFDNRKKREVEEDFLDDEFDVNFGYII